MYLLLACVATTDRLESLLFGRSCASGAAATVRGVGFWSVESAVATAAAGETVSVCAGTWPANLVIDRDVNLVGAGRTETVLDGQQRRVLEIDAAVSVSLSDLSITNGHAYESHGGAVSLSTGALTLRSVDVYGNSAAGDGGAVVLWYATRFEAWDSTFSDNDAAYSGGAVYGVGWYKVGDPSIRCHACVFTGNTALYGGAIAVSSAEPLRLDEGTEVRGNRAEIGGGLFDYGSTIELDNVILSGNSASSDRYGGGGVYIQNSRLTAANTLVTGNEAPYGGGLAGGADSVVSGLRIEGNEANLGGGVALCPPYGTPGDCGQLSDLIIVGNVAEAGGGLWGHLRYATTLSDSTVSGNTADEGGGLFMENGPEAWQLSAVNFATNTPDDVTTPAGSQTLGFGTDMTCTDNGCQ